MHPNIAVNTHKPIKITIAFLVTSLAVCLLKSTASGHFKSGAAFRAFCTCFCNHRMHFEKKPPPPTSLSSPPFLSGGISNREKDDDIDNPQKRTTALSFSSFVVAWSASTSWSSPTTTSVRYR
jgi:hypothetical protein